ncbi:tetraspanin-31 isoform X2 [Agelaius phoeniceus]|uniref:tetraspanin-31 isoform X2 n=1 Tax=Agelaius phoeniceus TaxID=39638 RepID=UPI004054E23E
MVAASPPRLMWHLQGQEAEGEQSQVELGAGAHQERPPRFELLRRLRLRPARALLVIVQQGQERRDRGDSQEGRGHPRKQPGKGDREREPAMVCGGFACSRNALCALNVVYVLVGVLLVAVAGWARGLAGGSSPPLLGGAFAVGVFLLLIAALGLLGALRHHQVLLFFYVLILGLVFLCQLGVSCACLALGPEAQERLLRSAWPLLSAGARGQLQLRLGCCGLGAPPGTPPPALEPPWEPPNCPARCRFPPGGAPPCPPCAPQLLQHSEQALRILGGVGLFFSFTEVLGVWLALRFRNQRDPRANPGAFL